ncbi:MAG: hypothetical protein ACXVAM_17235, partial [Vulcanimicrobiaceae bacterium]
AAVRQHVPNLYPDLNWVQVKARPGSLPDAFASISGCKPVPVEMKSIGFSRKDLRQVLRYKDAYESERALAVAPWWACLRPPEWYGIDFVQFDMVDLLRAAGILESPRDDSCTANGVEIVEACERKETYLLAPE